MTDPTPPTIANIPPVEDQTGACGMCSGWYTLTNDRLLRVHGAIDNRCLGSGSFPVMTEAMVTDSSFQ